MRKKLLIMSKMSNKLLNANPINCARYFQLNTVHKEDLDEMNQKLVEMQNLNRRMIIDYKEKDAKVHDLERDLARKNSQIEELKQQMNCSITQATLSLFKNNVRVYKSVLGINGRLEGEIIKLKAENCELKNQLEREKQKNISTVST